MYNFEANFNKMLIKVSNHFGISTNKDENVIYSEILSSEQVEEFLNNENIYIIKDNVNQIKSIWALAKYLCLIEQFDELLTLVTKDLNELLGDINTIKIHINKDFSRTITLFNINTNQYLDIKYSIDQDEKIYYKLNFGKWGWDISKAQLKALCKNIGFQPENFINTSLEPIIKQKSSWFKRIFKRK